MSIELVDIGDMSFFNNLKLLGNKWEEWEWEEIEFWRCLVRGAQIITGQTGSGKSTLLALYAHLSKKYFGQGVICDDANLFKPKFGAWQHLDWPRMLANLDQLSSGKPIILKDGSIIKGEGKMSATEYMADHLEDLFRSIGIDPYYKTIIIDEAAKRANKKRHNTNTVLIIGQMLRQIRHLSSLVLISSQEALKSLEPTEVLEFATGETSCVYDEDTGISYYSIKSRFLPKGPDGEQINYPITINPDNWKDIYNSFSRIQRSARELANVGGL